MARYRYRGPEAFVPLLGRVVKDSEVVDVDDEKARDRVFPPKHWTEVDAPRQAPAAPAKPTSNTEDGGE